MSGAASVPLAFSSYYVSNDLARLGLAATAIFCFGAASYGVWHRERKAIVGLHEKVKGQARLEIYFNETDPKCVRDEHYWYEGKPLKSRKWFVGIRNASSLKSADNVTVRAKASWFVDCSIATAHGNKAGDRIDTIIFNANSLEPGATEYIELFGMGPDSSQTPGEVFHRPHDFILEARARDTSTIQMALTYEPGAPPKVTL